MKIMFGFYKDFSPGVFKQRKAFWCFCLAFVGMMGYVRGYAQQPHAEVHIDSTQILIGSQFHLYLDITWPSSYRLQGYALPDSFNHIEVVDRSQADTLSTGGLWHFHQVLTLTSFDSGRWQIPAIPVVLAAAQPQDTTHLVLQTDSLWIAVQTVSVDTTLPFKPIKGIRQVKLTWLDILPYVLIGIGLVLLVLAIIYLVRRRKHELKPMQIEQPQQPPYEEAIIVLKQLQAEQAWLKMDMKAYFTQLTDVLRRYLERAFQIPAMEMTSGELLEHIEKQSLLRMHRAACEEILSEADRVKFAKWSSSPLVAAHCVALAIEVVEATHQAQEAERQAAEQAVALKTVSK